MWFSSSPISLQEIGKNPLVIEKGNMVNAILSLSQHIKPFSVQVIDWKLEMLRLLPINRKPKRNEALAYYREVVKRKNIRMNAYEKVMSVGKQKGRFIVTTDKAQYEAHMWSSQQAIMIILII